jgi:spermidine/putrescine transport system ATP-binding protein
MISPERLPLVRIDNVFIDFGDYRALHPTSLTVNDGEFLTIVGPSGSGKTTILKILGGFIAPSGGKVSFKGEDITALPPERRPFNTVFQDYALFPHMSVAENIAYSLRLRKVPKHERMKAADEALAIVGLSGLGGRAIQQLSGGQQQRVALARAIVAKPAVILLDEPLSALDASMRHQMRNFLKSVQRQLRTTFLFVTHDQEEALSMSDRIVVMNKGRIEQIGDCDSIYCRPTTEFVARFVGRNNVFPGQFVPGKPGLVSTPAGLLATSADGSRGGNSKVLLTVRPERIRVQRASDPAINPGEHRIEAIVEAVSFVGAYRSYLLSIPGAPGVVIEASVPSKDNSALTEGERVVAIFNASDLNALAPT